MAKFDLTDKKLLAKLKSQVNYLCSIKFKIGNTDDMFQSICLKIMENPNTKASIANLFIDVLRDEYGRKDSGLWEERKALKNAVNYYDAMKSEKSDSPETAIINKILVEKMMAVIEEPIVRQIIHDIYFLGMTRCEIAEKLNTWDASIGYKEKWAFEDIREYFPEECPTLSH